MKIVLPSLSTLHSVAILFKNCIKTGSYPPSYPHSHYFMLTNPHLFVKKLSNFRNVFPLRFWRFARFFPIFPRRFCLSSDKLSFFGRISTFFCNINARFLKYLNFVVCFARNNMRKITSYLSLPVISGSQHKILGTITGVLCEKRLKSVGFFAFSDLYSKDSENMYVAARSLKKINDDSVVLSNLYA